VSHEHPDAGPRVIELIGPAGVGKTGLLRAVAGLAPGVRTGLRLDRVRALPVVARHAIALTPATLDMLFTDPRSLWAGLRHLWRLGAFPSLLERARGSGHQTILLDEGPVFSLGRLSVFQRAHEGSGWLAQAWTAEVARWRTSLTGVVLLDANNDVLAQRIRNRAKQHPVKHGSDRQIFAFLDGYRAAYRDIATRLSANGRVHVVELDTATRPFEEIAADIVTAMNTWGHRPEPVTAQRRA
jgi:energy-coupling factor transporter ATP-binding protein EcfA2